MVKLIAECWDRYGVPAPEGEVCHLFKSACYVRNSTGGLCAITDRPTGVLPGGLSVDLPAGMGFADLIAVGSRAAVRGGVLRFDCGVTIDLRFAAPWGPMPGMAADARDDIQVSAVSATRNRFRRLVRRTAPDILPTMDRLSWSPAGLRAAPRWLIGLGPGLTPAGDDYLIGFAAGLQIRAGSATTSGRAALLAGIAARVGTTTDVSRLLLDGALRGVFPGKLVDMAQTVLRPSDADTVDRACSSLAGLGHSSGAAMGLGFFDALATVFKGPAVAGPAAA